MKQCTVLGCNRAVRAKGLCPGHYERQRQGRAIDAEPLHDRSGDSCSIEGCDRPRHGKGMCGAHYYRSRHGKDMEAPVRDWKRKRGASCAVEGCGRKDWHVGLCNTHYKRQMEGDSKWNRPIKDKGPDGTGTIDRAGYRRIYVDGRLVAEHRHFAELELGRKLERCEDVHHRNGVRDDNRTNGQFVLNHRGHLVSGNLEIWSTNGQPRGQEIGPKVDWATEFLERYSEFLRDDTLRRLAAIVGERLNGSERP